MQNNASACKKKKNYNRKQKNENAIKKKIIK